MKEVIDCPNCKIKLRLDENNNCKERYIQCFYCGVVFLNKFYKEKKDGL